MHQRLGQSPLSLEGFQQKHSASPQRDLGAVIKQVLVSRPQLMLRRRVDCRHCGLRRLVTCSKGHLHLQVQGAHRDHSMQQRALGRPQRGAGQMCPCKIVNIGVAVLSLQRLCSVQTDPPRMTSPYLFCFRLARLHVPTSLLLFWIAEHIGLLVRSKVLPSNYLMNTMMAWTLAEQQF